MLGRVIVAVAVILGTPFAASAQGDRRDIVGQIHEQITRSYTKYIGEQRTKALSGCINWENSTPNNINVRHLLYYYAFEGGFLPSTLMRSAINACNERRKKNDSNCKCVPISKNGRSALKVPDSFIKKVRALRTPPKPAAPVTNKPDLGFVFVDCLLSRRTNPFPHANKFIEEKVVSTTQDACLREGGRILPALETSTSPKAVLAQPGTMFRDCPDCPEMVVIPAGSFSMGSSANEKGRSLVEGPRHRVTIPRAFALGKYEVTFSEWDTCVRAGGCSHRPKDEGWGRSNRPVINVSWKDAKQYVGWLSRKTGHAYRLPSEAEWEYAARAGTTTARYWGNDPDRACGHGNVHDRTSKSKNQFDWTHHDCLDGYARTAPVGNFGANGFGLYDVLGNVWEWVEDCWNDRYSGSPGDGSAWTIGECTRRILRGGSWFVIPSDVRSADRNWNGAGIWNDDIGFRVARTLGGMPKKHPPKIAALPPSQPEPRRAPPLPTSKRAPSLRPDLKLSSTGSGFYVSRDGYIVTNKHVVDGCKALAVKGADKAVRPVSLIGSAANSDLALLKADFHLQSFAAFKKGKGARPGESVALIGFPLVGYLASTANITLGNVSADAGPRDDPGILQITAPVQPGNSGGPLLDAWGHLIGVVVSAIKKKKFAEAFGRPPENVNFAIKARLVRSLLDAHGVNYRTEAATTKLDPAGIYERARPFTVLIGCWK